MSVQFSFHFRLVFEATTTIFDRILNFFRVDVRLIFDEFPSHVRPVFDSFSLHFRLVFDATTTIFDRI